MSVFVVLNVKAKREELAQSVISNIMLRRNVIFVVIDNVFNF